jgi:predicted flap endonuclease-1-like 5' DNA nuclease
MEQGIETINGIGPKSGGLLRNSGVKTVNDLLRVGATERGRQHLANKVGVTYATLLKWVYRGDLLRINGVGKKYSALLESAGVNTITDLSMRNPSYLCQTLRIVNREKNLVRRTPPSKTIEIWVKNAKTSNL